MSSEISIECSPYEDKLTDEYEIKKIDYKVIPVDLLKSPTINSNSIVLAFIIFLFIEMSKQVDHKNQIINTFLINLQVKDGEYLDLPGIASGYSIGKIGVLIISIIMLSFILHSLMDEGAGRVTLSRVEMILILSITIITICCLICLFSYILFYIILLAKLQLLGVNSNSNGGVFTWRNFLTSLIWFFMRIGLDQIYIPYPKSLRKAVSPAATAVGRGSGWVQLKFSVKFKFIILSAIIISLIMIPGFRLSRIKSLITLDEDLLGKTRKKEGKDRQLSENQTSSLKKDVRNFISIVTVITSLIISANDINALENIIMVSEKGVIKAVEAASPANAAPTPANPAATPANHQIYNPLIFSHVD